MSKDFIEKRVETMSFPWIVTTPTPPTNSEIYAILEGYRNQGGEMLMFDRILVAEYPIPWGYHKSEIGRGWEWNGAGYLIVPEPNTGLWLLTVWGFEDYWITIYWWVALPPLFPGLPGLPGLIGDSSPNALVSGVSGSSVHGARRGKKILWDTKKI